MLAMQVDVYKGVKEGRNFKVYASGERKPQVAG
jgi:hypothetical protein